MWFLLILVLIAIVGALGSSPESRRIGDAATMLAVIGGVAVGIERFLEVVWTVVDVKLGANWPRGLTTEISAYLDALDGSLKPFLSTAEAELKRLKDAGTLVGSDLTKAEADVAALGSAALDVRASGIDDKRVQELAALVGSLSGSLQKAEPAVNLSMKETLDALEKVTSFLATFDDNPGRKLISIGAGALIGLLIATVVGLDVFTAVFDTNSSPPTTSSTATANTTSVDSANGISSPRPSPSPSNSANGDNKRPPAPGLHWGVAFTGIVIGLGSNPTHEVIGALQQLKKAQK